jgi:hypothetical protein
MVVSPLGRLGALCAPLSGTLADVGGYGDARLDELEIVGQLF